MYLKEKLGMDILITWVAYCDTEEYIVTSGTCYIETLNTLGEMVIQKEEIINHAKDTISQHYLPHYDRIILFLTCGDFNKELGYDVKKQIQSIVEN